MIFIVGFSMVEEVPDCHKFKGQEFAAADAKSFFSSITREVSSFQPHCMGGDVSLLNEHTSLLR